MAFKIKPAPQAYVLIALTIVLFLAATNIQSGWLYIIDSLLASLLFFSAITPLLQTKKIKLKRSFSPSVYEGESIEITIEIKNTGKRVISFAGINDQELNRKAEIPYTLSTENNSVFFIELLPEQAYNFSYILYPEIRGLYQFNKFMVTSYGPFGLFRFSTKLEAKNQLLVLPNIPVLSNFFFSGLHGSGYKYSAKTKKNLEANMPYNIRKYRPGDSRRLIHWRSSARLNQLMVKELESDESFSIQLILDTQRGNSFGQGKENNFEYMLKMAGAIFKLCLNKNYKVELLYYEKEQVKVLTELTPWPQVLDNFAYLDTDNQKTIRNLLQEKEISQENIIMPFFLNVNEEDLEVLTNLNKNNYLLLPIFTEIHSFDKKQASLQKLISQSPCRYLVLNKGDDFHTKSI